MRGMHPSVELLRRPVRDEDPYGISESFMRQLLLGYELQHHYQCEFVYCSNELFCGPNPNRIADGVSQPTMWLVCITGRIRS